MAFTAAGAVVGASVGLGLGAGGFIDSNFGGSFVGVSSTIALTATLASGVGATIRLPPPQATNSNINAAGRRSDIVSLRLISLSSSCT
ncbi:MAG TPA: hypothetical protein EYN92_01090 [Dehalococcoidia bacterium]|nr:hypothetical protein [Dehalococcoidia bacterium]